MALKLSGSTGISGNDGSVSAPAYAGSTANTSGLYFPSSTTLALGTSGTEALRIDGSQRVGVGTGSNFVSLFAVQAASASPTSVGNGSRFLESTNGYGLNLGGSSSGYAWIQGMRGGTTSLSYNDISLQPNGGNIGIGTISPSTKLTILSSTNAGIAVNDGTVNTILYNTSSVNGSLGTTTNHPFAFYTNNSERMRIDSSGNVGIGTNGPSNKLDVYQAATTPTSPVRVLYSAPSVTYANTHVVVQNMNGANGDKALYGASLQATGGNGYNPVGFGAIQTNYLNRNAAFVVYVSDSDNFSVASHERMRIDASGYVTKPYQPFLRAIAGGGTFPSLVGTGTTIPYNTIVTQVGSNYNTSTYRFTAPVAGRYMVYASLEASGTNTTYSNLMICVNGASQSGTYKNMTGASYQMMNDTSIVTCAVGDFISIIYYASGTSGTIENAGDARNIFVVYFLG